MKTYPKAPNPDLEDVPLASLGLDSDQTVRLRSERGTFRVKSATRHRLSLDVWVTLYGGPASHPMWRSVDRSRIVVKKGKRVEK